MHWRRERLQELEIPNISLQQVRNLASWSGIEDAVNDDLLRVIAAPVVAVELRRIADASRETYETVDLLDILRSRAEELDEGESSMTMRWPVPRPRPQGPSQGLLA